MSIQCMVLGFELLTLTITARPGLLAKLGYSYSNIWSYCFKEERKFVGDAKCTRD